MLDADVVPMRDPSYMFDAPEFRKNGNYFWGDIYGEGMFNDAAFDYVGKWLSTASEEQASRLGAQFSIDRLIIVPLLNVEPAQRLHTIVVCLLVSQEWTVGRVRRLMWARLTSSAMLRAGRS